MKPQAIIFDRDGTLASCPLAPTDRRDPAAWRDFNAAMVFDPPVPAVVALTHAIRSGVAVIVVSGRSAGDHPGDWRRRFAMQDWLAKHNVRHDALFMRDGGDMRPDHVVKHDILHRDILPRWRPVFAVDDRPTVQQVWRDHGIGVLAVTDPGLRFLI